MVHIQEQHDSIRRISSNIKRLPEEYEKRLVGLDKHKRSFEIQLIILRIKEKEYRHYHWLMCKKKISKRDWKSASAQALYFFNSPKGIFKETSAPSYASISDFGTLYSWRSPSLVITTVFPSIASTFPAS
jgi:hypothetical protein